MSEPRREGQNQEESIPERESGIFGFVGFDAEQEESIRGFFKETFLAGGDVETIKQYEREKTKEEERLIGDVLSRMPEFIRKWGGAPLNLSEENIHFLESTKMGGKDLERLGGAGYTMGRELVYITGTESTLKTAIHLVHELIHFNSFQSVQPENGVEKTFLPRRTGFEIHSGGSNVSFKDINEAITVELQKRFEAEYFESIPMISDEVNRRGLARDEIRKTGEERADDIAIILNEKQNGNKTYWTFEYYTYGEERERLWKIIDKIYQENSEDFHSKEEIFAIFAEASLSGRLLPVARLVEKTFGKGSFRALGEETKSERASK